MNHALTRWFAEHRRLHEVGLRHGVIEQHWLSVFLGAGVRPAPVDEVAGLVRLRPGLGVAVDVGQNCRRHAVAQVGHLFAEGLQLVVRLPLSELQRADLGLCLPYAFAEGEGESEPESTLWPLA